MGAKKKIVEVVCANCDKTFLKSVSEFNRSERLGKRHFCSLSCTQLKYNKDNPNHSPNMKGLRSGNKRDKYTRFRWFMRCVKNRVAKRGPTNLTLEYLKQLWDEQEGVCPLTGWKLMLPNCSDGWKSDTQDIKRASLDRIDCSKGYLQGNVRFISYMANIARGSFEDKHVIEFCRAVAVYNVDRIFRVQQGTTV